MAGEEVHEGLVSAAPSSRTSDLYQVIEPLLREAGFVHVRVTRWMRERMYEIRARHACGVLSCYVIPETTIERVPCTRPVMHLIAHKMIASVQGRSEYHDWSAGAGQNLGLDYHFITPPHEGHWTDRPPREVLRTDRPPGADQQMLEMGVIDDALWLRRWLEDGKSKDELDEKAVGDALDCFLGEEED